MAQTDPPVDVASLSSGFRSVRPSRLGITHNQACPSNGFWGRICTTGRSHNEEVGTTMVLFQPKLCFLYKSIILKHSVHVRSVAVLPHIHLC